MRSTLNGEYFLTKELFMDGKSRKRGIKASRVKLDKAMLEAGFKTQASLAEHIAQNENLETAPKDTINRAFRQESVSPTTVARIARALEVEAFTLYLSKQENDRQNKAQLFTQTKSEVEPSTNYLISKRYIFILITSIIILTSGILLWKFNTATNSSSSNQILKMKTPILGKNSLVVYSYSKITDHLSDLLADVIAEDSTVVKVNRTHLKQRSMSVDIAREYQADGVLTIRSSEVKRYIGIQVYLYYQGHEDLIWSESFSKTEFQFRRLDIVATVEKFLSERLNGSRLAINHQDSVIDMQSQEKYLKARELLDNFQSEINLKQAKEYLTSAIIRHPNFANAHAAICEYYIYDSWRGNEKEHLENAQLSCNKAVKLSDRSAYANSTLAYLYRRTGRVRESIALYNKILDWWPDNIDALSGLASSYLDAYRQDLPDIENAKTKMIKYAKLASLIEPDYWQHHSSLGTLKYFVGDMQSATVDFEKAANLNPNELAYTNVGTMHRCLGNIDKAEEFYLLAQNLAPNSHLGDDFLGSIYYHKGLYSKSAQLKEQALAKLKRQDKGGIHQIWGELADAYRKSGNIQKSIDAYLNAMQIIKRDKLRGNITVADKIYQFYYLEMLSKISPTNYSNDELKLNISELEQVLKNNTDVSSNAKLALLFHIKNEKELATQALEKATSKCPIYKTHPDLLEISVIH